MKNKIEDLRDHLFVAIENLNGAEKPAEIQREIQRARAVANVGQVLVNSARAETEFLRIHGSAVKGSGFVPLEPRRPALPGNGDNSGR